MKGRVNAAVLLRRPKANGSRERSKLWSEG